MGNDFEITSESPSWFVKAFQTRDVMLDLTRAEQDKAIDILNDLLHSKNVSDRERETIKKFLLGLKWKYGKLLEIQ